MIIFLIIRKNLLHMEQVLFYEGNQFNKSLPANSIAYI